MRKSIHMNEPQEPHSRGLQCLRRRETHLQVTMMQANCRPVDPQASQLLQPCLAHPIMPTVLATPPPLAKHKT